MDVSALGGSFDSEVRRRVMRDGQEALPGQERSCGTAQPAPGLGTESVGEVPMSFMSRNNLEQTDGAEGPAAGLGGLYEKPDAVCRGQRCGYRRRVCA